MPNTTRGFPYPSSGDDVDVPGDLAALATAIDSNLTNVVEPKFSQIEGTAIKATGVAANYVLSANGSNGASWTTIPGAGGFASGSVTFASQKGTNWNQRAIYAGTAARYGVCTTNNGTVTASIGRNSSTTSILVRTHNALLTDPTADGTAGTVGSLTVPVIVAGTFDISTWSVSGKGFANGSGILITQGESATTTGNYTYTVRKYNTTLATNAWNATILSGVTPTVDTSYKYKAGFTRFGQGWEYVNEHDVWIAGESRNKNATSDVTRFYAINDTSGSVYSGTFAVAANANESWNIDSWAFVPNATSGSGTVYVMGYVYDDSARYYAGRLVKFALGSAGISAVGTTTSASISSDTNQPNYPVLETTVGLGRKGAYPTGMLWDAANTAILVSTQSNAGVVAYDRTFTNELWRTGYTYPFGIIGNDKFGGHFDPTNRWVANSSGVFKLWGAGQGGYTQVAYDTSANLFTLCGTGAATSSHMATGSNGNADAGYYYHLQRVYQVTSGTVFGTANVGRLVFYDHANTINAKILSVQGGTAFTHFGMFGTVQANGQESWQGQRDPYYLPAGAPLVVNYQPIEDIRPYNGTGTVSATATAKVTMRAITLS